MPAFEFQTSGSSIQTVYTYSAFKDERPSLPTPSPGEVDGLVYVCHVRITAGDDGFSEPRVAMERIRALLYFNNVQGLVLDSQEVIESLNNYLALSVSLSSGNILVRVDPLDSSIWYVRGYLGLATYTYRQP